MQPPFKLDYDEIGDAIYLSGSDNRPARGDEVRPGVVLRWAEDNGELVGVTIINPTGK